MPKPFGPLLRRRQCLVPTWRGLVLAAGLAGLLAWTAALNVMPFLAGSEAAPGGVLVVEGWAPDYVLAEAAAEFRRQRYERLFVTGGPVERGALLQDYPDFASLGAATLLRMGMPAGAVEAVPASAVIGDRTYASAMALRSRLLARGPLPGAVHVLSHGAHARRTRLLFQAALGDAVRVGITAVPDRDFDPDRWWASSEGVRSVIGETIAYAYARFLFRPD